MFLLIVMLLIPLTFESIKCDKDIIPVFLMDYSDALKDIKIKANPFHKISTAQFADIVYTSIKRGDVVIIFIDDEFSTEDTSTKDALGTPYRNLEDGLLDSKVKYLPKVIEPYRLLKQMFQPHQFNVFHLDAGEVNLQNMLDQKLKHLYIFFRDGKNETRVEMLRRHDLIMREVYTVMTKLVKGPVLAFYTGKTNPVQVDKLDFVPIAPAPEAPDARVMVVTDGALFQFSGVYAATHSRRALFNQAPVVAEETWTDKTLSTKMAYSDFDLEFNFQLRTTDWLLDSVTLFEGGEEVGRTATIVSAPWYHSYYCGEPLVVINKRDGSSVTISEYQESPAGPNRDKAIGAVKIIANNPRQGPQKHQIRSWDYYYGPIDHKPYLEIEEYIDNDGPPRVVINFTPFAKKLMEDNADIVKNDSLFKHYIRLYDYNRNVYYSELPFLIEFLHKLVPTTTTTTTTTPGPDEYVLHSSTGMYHFVKTEMRRIKLFASPVVRDILLRYVSGDLPVTISRSDKKEMDLFIWNLYQNVNLSLNATIARLLMENKDMINSNETFEALRPYIQHRFVDPRMSVSILEKEKVDYLIALLAATTTTTTTSTTTTRSTSTTSTTPTTSSITTTTTPTTTIITTPPGKDNYDGGKGCTEIGNGGLIDGGNEIGKGCTAVEGGDSTPEPNGSDGGGATVVQSSGGDGQSGGGDGQGVPDEENPECGGFGTTVNCTPYFSVGILSALFLVFIWVLALAIGFSALHDIQSNDRFDDPHGKMPDTSER